MPSIRPLAILLSNQRKMPSQCRLMVRAASITGLRRLWVAQKYHRFRNDSIDPPPKKYGERDGGAVVPGQLVVSCCDPAPIFQMREGALDHVAALIRDLVERWDFLAGWIGLDDRGAAPCNQEFAKLITVIGCVGQHLGCLRQLLDEAWRWANIAHLPSGDVEGDQTAGRVGDGM